MCSPNCHALSPCMTVLRGGGTSGGGMSLWKCLGFGGVALKGVIASVLRGYWILTWAIDNKCPSLTPKIMPCLLASLALTPALMPSTMRHTFQLHHTFGFSPPNYEVNNPSSLFLDRISLGSPECPRTQSVDQASLELAEIPLPLSSECWN